MLQSFSGIKYREEHGYFQKTFRKNWDIVDKGRCQTLTFAIQQMKPDLDLTTVSTAKCDSLCQADEPNNSC